MTKKLGVFFHRLGPYHHARLAAASKLGSIIAIELTYKDSIYEWDVVSHRNGFEKITIFSKDDVIENTLQLNKRIIVTLNGIKPDILAIPGWGSKHSLIALNWCVENNVPAVLMSESTYGDATRNPVKEAVKARIVGCFSTALVGGGDNSDYLKRLGFCVSAIWQGYDVVDNDYFGKSALEIKIGLKRNRNLGNLPERFFLASGRFVEKKNHLGLIQAYACYRERSEDPPWDLIILGDGPLRVKIEALVNKLSLNDCVKLPGFKQYGELPKYYGLAGAFVHPSTVEQWGLVVNEAMASGLPVLVSKRCGCARDLVQEGVNGYTFDPVDVEGLALLLGKIADDDRGRHCMGRASKQIIDKWSPHTFAENLWKAANFAAQNPTGRIGNFNRLLLKLTSRTFKYRK